MHCRSDFLSSCDVWRVFFQFDNNVYELIYIWLQVIPCAVLSVLVHPSTHHHIINKISWAFCVYLEAVSVLPQLRVMQNTKVLLKKLETSLYPWPLKLVTHLLSQIVEPFTAHYVFALGIARFLSCAHWVLQVFSSFFLTRIL